MKIGFWGNFGTHNFGNECTLHAMLSGARRHSSGAEFHGISNDPVDTIERHHISALPISRSQPSAFARLPRPLRQLLHLMISEPQDWLRVMRAMRRIDVLVMTGTGMITDANEGAMGAPYQMFKWVLSAKVAGKNVKYVSVGTETLTHSVQQFWLATSLRLANYRSFRDEASRERAARLTSRVLRDGIYPDLAFSLPESLVARRVRAAHGKTTVAVGIYAVEWGTAMMRNYVETIGMFIVWLIDHGYRVRIVIGDAQYDTSVRVDLRNWLAGKNALSQVIDELASSFEQLMDQLADVDLVVATRFHNVLLSLVLGKPVLSLSHMDKNDQLMHAMGMSAYCRSLKNIRLEEVVALFQELEKNAEDLRRSIKERGDFFREQLEQQYAALFQDEQRPHASE